jgi:DNA-binding NtrC family response regulator
MSENNLYTQILLIDDDEINNFLNNKFLKRYNPEVKVDICISAITALEKLNDEYNPNLILLDLNMPQINGWSFLDEFRKKNKKIPVIILTSSIDPHDHIKSKRYEEVIDFIEKPLSTIKISRIFESILKEKT